VARRTKEAAQETRNGILDAAERIFSERGVSRTSLGDVAAAAGLTRGAIYWHFRDKADLFNAMIARVTLPMEDQVCGAWNPSVADPLSHIRNRLTAVLERTSTDPQCRRVFHIVYHKCEYVDEMKQVWKRLGEMRAGCLAHVEQGFRDAIARGQLPHSVNAHRAAIGIYAMVDGLINNWVIDPDYSPQAREAERMIDLYLNGLRRTPLDRPGAARLRAKRRRATGPRPTRRSRAA
jgi:TetR/AcrR family acrAB operon transcriptional repressor